MWPKVLKFLAPQKSEPPKMYTVHPTTAYDPNFSIAEFFYTLRVDQDMRFLGSMLPQYMSLSVCLFPVCVCVACV